MISPLSLPFPFSPSIAFQLINKQERNLNDKAGDSLHVDLAVLHIPLLGLPLLFLSLPFAFVIILPFCFPYFDKEEGRER